MTDTTLTPREELAQVTGFRNQASREITSKKQLADELDRQSRQLRKEVESLQIQWRAWDDMAKRLSREHKL